MNTRADRIWQDLPEGRGFVSFRPLSEKKQDDILCVLSASNERSEWAVKQYPLNRN
jgi:hypothetical protein